ncbi:ribosomal protein S5-alanine N-acetyltransferase [Vibrio sp. SM6]|uniref:Ribosomal protein S5-alanine N-acetyltransferase n=1 Tax=Vibrio agarilyticus TaxID=2726741 RepID=A0A7X8TQ11_9VIBR|nr:ribosomal protein S5-alanine N-acetyltransferase [Vibrio agarilyticus]NLS12629.1 ribosomal protein S5-alanine N-acetyltransferase [Vibrio agarilyticus]
MTFYSGIYLEREQVVVRAAEPDDATLISTYFSDNREYLKPWEPTREADFFTPFGWQKKLVKLHELHKLGLGYYLLIIDARDQSMLGTISFSNLTRYPLYACTVGYSLAQTAQGRGIMRQALLMACQYMFEVQNMHRIQAAYMPKNARSENVLKALGFVQEGLAKDYLLIDGHWQDHVLVSLVNSNWKMNQTL